MSNHGLDGGAAPELFFDLAMNPTLLAGSIDAQGFGRVVADIALVDIGSFDFDTGEILGFGDDGTKGVTVIGRAQP